MKYRLKHVAEYAALRAISGLVNILPHRVALGIGWGLAWIAFNVIGWRVDAAQERIREVFGDRFSDREVRRIAWISLRNTLFNAVEVVRIPSVNMRWVERTTDYREAVEKYNRLKDPEKGAVFALPHTGNWDLAGYVTGLFNIPVFFIVGKQRNPLFDNYINRMRQASGIETIPRDDRMLARKVLKNLKQKRVLAMTNDLRSKTQAISVQYLGKEANIVGGMAVFARQADVPVFPIIVTREGWARHRWQVFDPLVPDKTRDKAEEHTRLTQEVMKVFEQIVREHPEQYFWYNKRWVLDPFVDAM